MRNTEEMVSFHVQQNAGELISSLLKHEDYQDQLSAAFIKDDFENPALDAGYTLEIEDDGVRLMSPDGDPLELYNSTVEAYGDACTIEGLDPYTDEAMEYWLVSDMLAYQLLKRGEMVESVAGLDVWGRCATGSAIYMDDVMVHIAEQTSI